MTSEFWIGEVDMDEEQKTAVRGMDQHCSFLLTGPAGSGKTNILLLRSKWLRLKNLTNFKIVVFTSSLRDFVKVGCDQYHIPSDHACTAMQLFKDFLVEYDIPFELDGSFETDRQLLASKIHAYLLENDIDPIYDALLVDEAQDYTDTELRIFRALTERLVLSADSRQSIYRVSQTQGLMEDLTSNNLVKLKYHYRSGYQICRVADNILTDSKKYPRISNNSKYDEAVRPSSVERVDCSSLSDQILKIIESLAEQLILYPQERIGVLFPKNIQVAQFKNSLIAADFDQEELERIHCLTIHASKGWEFRAVHIGACETISQMRATQKRLAYTAVLRGKTAVTLYFSGNMPGYLESSLRVLSPPVADPSFDSLFGE